MNDVGKVITDLKVSAEQKLSELPKPSLPIIETADTAKEFDGIRTRGLQKSDVESSRERNGRKMSQVKAIPNLLEIDCEITELQGKNNNK